MDSSSSSSSLKRAPAEAVQFRLLCPSARTGAIIGKGGSVIRHLQSLTAAKIRVIDDIPVPSEERVVLISGRFSVAKEKKNEDDSGENSEENPNREQQKQQEDCTEREDQALSAGQKALVKVLERIVFGDDAGGEIDDVAMSESEALCRMLVGGNHLGFMGRDGRVMENIRKETGANVWVCPRDQVPACAFPGDEVIQIAGTFSAVKKALLSISNFLQESSTHHHGDSGSFPQRGYPPDFHSPDYHQRDFFPNHVPDDGRAYNRMVMEEEVVFKLLCQADKAGSLIGKGGSIVRAMQNETGALIKVTEPAHDLDERVVVISARENSEQRHSPAQDAVIRVHNRIAEIGFEPNSPVIARLLVPSPQIRRILGKGGHIITEMRRATGASIRVFQKDHPMKYETKNDEVLQIVGKVHCVQDALFDITSRIRDLKLPMRHPCPSMGGPPPFMPPFSEGPPPPFRPRHYPTSPGPFHSPIPPQPHEHPLGYSHMGPYPYGSEVPNHGPPFDRPPSPRSWVPQAVSDAPPMGMADMSCGFASRNEAMPSENQASGFTSSTVEVVIPQAYLTHVYGENEENLNHIKQISGANVIVHDPKPGATEGVVIVSGTIDQSRFAQCLIQAFILCGQPW